jgi:nitrate reductase cytochrome c-type subunit
MEHNGDHGLISKEADFCVGCHASMKALKPDATILNVPHFKDHPQFRVSVVSEQGQALRVAIDDSSKAVDRSAIKLNHEVHLQPGLRGAAGPVNLSCASCHQPDKDFKGLQPISFEKHCRECHSLGFDDRLPDSQVPHGDAEAVYPALFTEYVKLVAQGGGRAEASKQAESARLFPSDEGEAKQAPLQVAGVEQSARDAERQLFTRTGCFLCHEFQEKGQGEKTSTNSHYRVVKPGIPPVWLTGARFSHGAHEEFSCESCHEKTRKSSKTSDILLPGIQLCQQCHSQEAKLGYVESGCVTCHSYHDAIGFPGEKKQTIADYLNSLTR